MKQLQISYQKHLDGIQSIIVGINGCSHKKFSHTSKLPTLYTLIYATGSDTAIQALPKVIHVTFYVLCNFKSVFLKNYRNHQLLAILQRISLQLKLNTSDLITSVKEIFSGLEK